MRHAPLTLKPLKRPPLTRSRVSRGVALEQQSVVRGIMDGLSPHSTPSHRQEAIKLLRLLVGVVQPPTGPEAARNPPYLVLAGISQVARGGPAISLVGI